MIVSYGGCVNTLVAADLIHHLIVVVVAKAVALLISHGLAIAREFAVELINVLEFCGRARHGLVAFGVYAARDPFVPARDHKHEGLLLIHVLTDQRLHGVELRGKAQSQPRLLYVSECHSLALGGLAVDKAASFGHDGVMTHGD